MWWLYLYQPGTEIGEREIRNPGQVGNDVKGEGINPKNSDRTVMSHFEDSGSAPYCNYKGGIVKQ